MTNSQQNLEKIADFLIMAYFWDMCQFWVHMLQRAHCVKLDSFSIYFIWPKKYREFALCIMLT